MIRIKAPRVWRLHVPGYRSSYYRETRMGAAPGRFYSEAMHRRVVALVRACEDDTSRIGLPRDIHDALAALRAQAEKEAGK